MTKDDIIRMAEEAGLEWIRGLSGAGYHINHTDALERFAALVAAEMKKRADQETAMQGNRITLQIKGLHTLPPKPANWRGELGCILPGGGGCQLPHSKSHLAHPGHPGAGFFFGGPDAAPIIRAFNFHGDPHECADRF